MLKFSHFKDSPLSFLSRSILRGFKSPHAPSGRYPLSRWSCSHASTFARAASPPERAVNNTKYRHAKGPESGLRFALKIIKRDSIVSRIFDHHSSMSLTENCRIAGLML
jgi:hypothetical protein